MNKPAQDEAVLPLPSARRPGPLRPRGRWLRRSALAALPLVLVGWVVSGASARTERARSPTVFEPQESLRLAPKTTFRAHTPWVRTLAFHPRGHTLASGGSDGKLHTWNLSLEVPVAEGKTWSNPQGVC